MKCLLIVLVFVSCTTSNQPELPILGATGLTLRHYEHNNLTINLQAQNANLYSNLTLLTYWQLTVDDEFYSGDKVISNEELGEIELHNFYSRTADYTLASPHLFYRQNTGEAEAALATITSESYQISGENFNFSGDNQFSFGANVSLTVSAEEESAAITFTANTMNSFFRGGQNILLLEGNTRIESDDFEITAHIVELSGQDYNLIMAQGNVRIYRKASSTVITSDNFNYNRTTLHLTAAGNVYIIDAEQNLRVRSLFLEQAGENANYFLSGSVIVMKDEIFARAGSAIYDSTNETLLLIGEAEAVQDGNVMRADRIEINTATNTIRMVGNVSGRAN
ncbi:MAG: hypothetical protein FWE37_05140 [Spirochaetaceae bacterium]|nr:hypothetical protein [Spirochaetaceae bacterium]